MTPEERFDKMIDEPDSFKCHECGHRMQYNGNELYTCPACDNYYITEYGRLKAYLREHGGCSMMELSNATGIRLKKIQTLISKGDIEVF